MKHLNVFNIPHPQDIRADSRCTEERIVVCNNVRH